MFINCPSNQKVNRIGSKKDFLKMNCVFSVFCFHWLRQGTLYTREGYGTICAVVNQLWAWQFYHCTKFVFIVLKAYSTVYKEFPDWGIKFVSQSRGFWVCQPFRSGAAWSSGKHLKKHPFCHKTSNEGPACWFETSRRFTTNRLDPDTRG